tara:strand:+ start:5091 stop:6059 length:969 start_codon:yes stop_codon:yes gene_type:complete
MHSIWIKRLVLVGIVALLAYRTAGEFGATGIQNSTTGLEALVKNGITEKISDHVYVIPDQDMRLVPNVGIVVGSTGTLVIDTGLGPVNANTILREVDKVSVGRDLYIVSTHYHPEHAGGEAAFPAGAKVLRANAQQKDIDELGLDTLVRFRSFSPLVRELLAFVRYRNADVIFESEYSLDLGGVHVRLLALGTTHTRGDTMVFVEGDEVLFSGDVVMNQRFLVFSSPEAKVQTWLDVLGQVKSLRPRFIVPSHGASGDGRLIDQQIFYLKTITNLANQYTGATNSVEQTLSQITSEVKRLHRTWSGERWVEGAVRAAMDEAR